MLSECSSTNSRNGLKYRCGGFRLSADPISYMNFVATTVTTRPVQSAMALPKNAPQWVLGFEWEYKTIQPINTRLETMLSEWR
jgi:hypothetical protein